MKTNLSGANLTGVDLTQSIFMEANLTGARLDGAPPPMALFPKANLAGPPPGHAVAAHPRPSHG